MRNFQYIFWDLDGTIINSYRGVTNAIKYALNHFGITMEESEYRKFIGPPLRKMFPEFCGLTQEQTMEAIRIYREYYIPTGVYECDLFPEVPKALEAFRKAGKIQVLTSSKPEPQCRQILEKFHLTDQFDEIVGASLDGRIDTKIQVLNEAFRRMEQNNPKISRDQVVLIGDTFYDADGAREAGISCVGVTYGFGTAEELHEHGVKDVYTDLETLVENMI